MNKPPRSSAARSGQTVPRKKEAPAKGKGTVPPSKAIGKQQFREQAPVDVHHLDDRRGPYLSPTVAYGSGGEEPRFQMMPPIDFYYLYSVLRSNIQTVGAITSLSALLMFIYLQFVPPSYTANAQLMLDARKEHMTPVEGVVSNLDLTQSVLAGEVITIQSNVLLGKVVDTLGLIDSPAFDTRIPGRESFFAKIKRRLRGVSEEPHEFAARMPEETLRSWVISDLRRDLGVSQLGMSYAIGISYKSIDAPLAAQIANAVAEEYIQSQLSSKTEATERANVWLAKRIEELGVQVEIADQDVVNFKADMIKTANGNSESINQLLTELNSRLVDSATKRADAEVMLGQVEALLASGGLDMVADVVTSPLLEALQRQYAELAASQAQLASSLGVRHPDMIRIAAQISEINRSIEGEVRRRLEAMRSEVTVTLNREQALQSQIDEVSERANSLSMASVRLGQLERTADATRLVFENFLSRFKETSAQADFQTPEARIIGRAVTPAIPSEPRKTLLMLAAIVIGFAGSIAFVFLRNLVRTPVQTPEELVGLTNLPNLATLPYVKKTKSEYYWLHNELLLEDGSLYLEHVRAIRTGLFDMPRSKRPKIVLITSSVPNEGKTSLCCALGHLLSRASAKVLLLDADLRRPDIRKVLDLPEEGKCFAQYLHGALQSDELPQHSTLVGVDVISPVQPSRHAADLLISPRLPALLTEMSKHYDHIIINAPPVLHLADAHVLAQQSDATIFTVRCGSTRAATVRKSVQQLRSNDAALVGTVLTMVRRKDLAAQDSDPYSNAY